MRRACRRACGLSGGASEAWTRRDEGVCCILGGRGDIDTILAALTPDVSWESVGRPEDFPTLGPRHGIDGVREFFRLVAESLKFSDFSPRDFHAADGKVFVQGHYEATVRTTGRKAAADWVHIFTVKDGKVSRFREHTDTAQFAEAWRG